MADEFTKTEDDIIADTVERFESDEDDGGVNPPKETAALHSDELWGGPRWIENAGHEPVYVGTKKAYWKLLRRTGFRMHDQQESTTGETTEAPIEVPKELREPEVLPLTQQEAQVLGAMRAVFLRYGLIECVYCDDCFARHRAHGCRVIVNSREVSILCRCGKAAYHPPMGTTDTVLDTLSNTTITEMDKQPGTILTKVGELLVPSVTLPDMVADLIRAHVKNLRARNKEPRWFHTGCYEHRPENEDNAVGMNIGKNDVNIVCQCRQLFNRRTRGTLH